MSVFKCLEGLYYDQFAVKVGHISKLYINRTFHRLGSANSVKFKSNESGGIGLI